MIKHRVLVRPILLAATFLFAAAALAASGDKLNRESDKALQVFKDEISGADVFLSQAAGYLVFPRVIKFGIGIGAETGEGVLRVGGSTVGYYRTSSGSVGFQLGAQSKSIVIAFLTREALDKFRKSNGWKVGVDGSVALIDVGGGKTIDTDNVRGRLTSPQQSASDFRQYRQHNPAGASAQVQPYRVGSAVWCASCRRKYCRSSAGVGF